MFRRDTVTAPPEKSMLTGRIIQQRIRHILCGKFCAVSAVLQRPDKENRPVAVIVSRKDIVIYGIIPYFPIDLRNLFRCPVLHRRSQTNTYDLPQPSGVYLFYRLFRKLIYSHNNHAFLSFSLLF